MIQQKAGEAAALEDPGLVLQKNNPFAVAHKENPHKGGGLVVVLW